MKAGTFGRLTTNLRYPARLTFAAVSALVAARVLGFPEVYWAPISAVVVVQSDFGASLTISLHRLAGTAIGALGGALLAAKLGRGVITFGLGIFGIGLLSAALRLERPANRFAAIAFAIVFLVVRPEPAWVIALHRFLEVSVGIVAGLLLSAVWPEPGIGGRQSADQQPAIKAQ
ncbi:MAG TPA: FUSC family protein [Opitutaceae bacterium]|jgi:uncharacterized membrane protein YgaE (UPF0421/DUF939 family)|nr:FUSC family protein [Opitutaceae bacterium]